MSKLDYGVNQAIAGMLEEQRKGNIGLVVISIVKKDGIAGHAIGGTTEFAMTMIGNLECIKQKMVGGELLSSSRWK
jgi:hypothetical protein